MIRYALAFAVFAAMLAGMDACTPNTPNDLSKLATVRMTIKGQEFELWIADNDDTRERGLMYIKADEMAPMLDGTRRGMLFVFPRQQYMSFWMKNTIIPLDIAFLRSSGEVTATHTMAPLDTDLGKYTSGAPARYAIEVNANVFTDLGLKKGDVVEIPDSILNP